MIIYRYVMENVKIPLPLKPTKFLDQFRAFIRLDGKSYATENTYVYWVLQYILFHNKEHPSKMGVVQIEAYLSHLALIANTSPNTQKTALNAIMFLYNRFLKKPIEKLNFHYAKKPQKIPTVFTHAEAMAVIECLVMPYKLMAQLMYGSGLRISEALRLRVKDVDFAMGYLVIRDGKGGKDRTTLLPKRLIIDLKIRYLLFQNYWSLIKLATLDLFIYHMRWSKNIPMQVVRLNGSSCFLQTTSAKILVQMSCAAIIFTAVHCSPMLKTPLENREYLNKLVATHLDTPLPLAYCKPSMI